MSVDEVANKARELDDVKELCRLRVEIAQADQEYERGVGELVAKQTEVQATQRRLHMLLNKAGEAANRIMERRLIGDATAAEGKVS